jgi:hypothetical protein
MQLYEMDASLVASVIGALGAEFPHYAIFAASDSDLLIIAADAPLPEAADARVFEHPGVAKELWTVHVLTGGDLDARYLGARATLEPLFASYGMPANSDYQPVLDRNAARHRFMEKSAADIVALLNADLPLLELIEPGRSRRAVNPLFRGASSFERVENTRLAWYARDFLLRPNAPEPEQITAVFQKDLELFKVRLLECREPRERDVWLHSALRVAKALNPYLAADDVGAVWGRILASPCFAQLQDFQRRWVLLFNAVGARNAPRMAELASSLLETQRELLSDAREYLLLAGMTGAIASGDKAKALELWKSHHAQLRATGRPVLRLLRCHAERAGCEQAFRAYAER